MTLPPEIQGMLDQVKDSSALPYLLSGGAGALAGGTLAAMNKPRRGESKLGRLGRILGTAALTGGATAGAHKLFSMGGNTLSNALPADDVSPEQNAITGPVPRGLAALAAGGGMAAATHKADKARWGELGKAMSAKGVGAKGLEQMVGKNDPGLNQWKQELNRRFPMVPPGQSPGNVKFDTLNPDHEQFFRNYNKQEHIRGLLSELGIDHSGDGKNIFTKGLQKGVAGASPFLGEKLGQKAFEFSHEIPGRAVNLKNKIMPGISKFTGRSIPGAIGRAALMGGATMYPEILDELGKGVSWAGEQASA